MAEQPSLYCPRPRRVFDLAPASNESSGLSTPTESSNLDVTPPSSDVSRNGSVLNLTSPTLVGIYSPTAFETPRDECNTPWGTEADVTPNTSISESQEKSESDRVAFERVRLSQGLFRGIILPRTLRNILLFAFGVAYGIITIHLHDNHWITPVKLENVNRYSWHYLGFWGLAGIALGNILPWLDFVQENAALSNPKRPSGSRVNGNRTLSWLAAVRSVGAFVGIAFAMVCDNLPAAELMMLTFYRSSSGDSPGNPLPRHRSHSLS